MLPQEAFLLEAGVDPVHGDAGVKDAVEEGEEVADGIEADGSGDEVLREEVRGRWNAVPFFAEPGGCLRCCRGGVRSGGGCPGRSGR